MTITIIVALIIAVDIFLREWTYRGDRKTIRQRVAEINAGGQVGVSVTEVGHRRVRVEIFRWKTADEVLSLFTKPLPAEQVAPWLNGMAAALKLAEDGPGFALPDTLSVNIRRTQPGEES